MDSELIGVYLNGESQKIPAGLNLAGLIEWMKFPLDRVAVELNLEIVPRSRWDATTVRAGDRLEVVHFVGGG